MSEILAYEGDFLIIEEGAELPWACAHRYDPHAPECPLPGHCCLGSECRHWEETP